MKPLNFASLFALYFVLLIAFGAVTNIEDLMAGEFAVSIFIGLIAIVGALIMAFLTLKIRSTEKHNIKRIFNLYFILYAFLFLTMNVFVVLTDSTHLTFTKVLLSGVLTILTGYLGAKVSMLGTPKAAV